MTIHIRRRHEKCRRARDFGVDHCPLRLMEKTSINVLLTSRVFMERGSELFKQRLRFIAAERFQQNAYLVVGENG